MADYTHRDKSTSTICSSCLSIAFRFTANRTNNTYTVQRSAT